MNYYRQRRLLAKQYGKEASIQAEDAPLPLPNSPPYYHFGDEPERLPGSEHSEELLSKIHLWAIDYLVTHFAVLSVLGAIAFGGVAVTSILSRMKFPNIWSILFGILLFLGYLVFVGVTISLASAFGAIILRRLGKHKQ